METQKTRKAKATRVYNKTCDNMRKLGVFRDEFGDTIRRYSELRVQYDSISDEWYKNGCKITEEYTNNSGAKNQRKTALYLAMENLRKELSEMENAFGLTPKGLKAIRSKSLDTKKESALAEALKEMDG